MIQGIHHDNLAGYVANEHIDWTTDQGVVNIHNNNLANSGNWDTAYGWGDHSAGGYQAQDDVLDDLAALTVVADNEFIVGTGAGTYAHESGATARTSMGLGTIATQGADSIVLTGSGVAILDVEKTSALTNSVLRPLIIRHKTTSDMIDGFGVGLYLNAKDSGGTDRNLGVIDAVRDSADTEGKLIFRAGTGGTEKFMSIDHSGNVDIEFHDAATIGLELGGTLVTASAAELNIMDGVTVTAANINAAHAHVTADGSSHADVVTNSTYAGVGHLPLAGGTLTGSLLIGGAANKVPFIITAVMTGGATVTVYNANAPIAFRVIDAWLIGTSADLGSANVTDGTNVIVGVMAPSADKDSDRAPSIDDDFWDIAVDGSLEVVAVGKTPVLDAIIFIMCLPT